MSILQALPLHPKTTGATAGGGIGVVVVAVLGVFGVTLTPAEGSAIAALLGFALSYLAPALEKTAPAPAPPADIRLR